MRCSSSSDTRSVGPAWLAMKLPGQGRTWSTTAVLCTPTSVTAPSAGAAMGSSHGVHKHGRTVTWLGRWAAHVLCRSAAAAQNGKRHSRLRGAHLPPRWRAASGPMAVCTPHAAASAGAAVHSHDRALRASRAAPRCAVAPAHSVACRVGGADAASRAAPVRLSCWQGPQGAARRGSTARVAVPTTTCGSGVQSSSETSRCGRRCLLFAATQSATESYPEAKQRDGFT